MKNIVKHESKPDWYLLMEGDICRAAGSMEHCKFYAVKHEEFSDGSTIDTDELTGNRTVCGTLAHDEYFKRLRSERITRDTSPAIIAFCQNMDGSRKAELIRRNTSPLLIDTFGPYVWEVWTDSDPKNVQRCRDEESARKHFNAAMVHGTNGKGLPVA